MEHPQDPLPPGSGGIIVDRQPKHAWLVLASASLGVLVSGGLQPPICRLPTGIGSFSGVLPQAAGVLQHHGPDLSPDLLDSLHPLDLLDSFNWAESAR